MFCYKCGAQLDNQALFCQRCGSAVGSTVAPAAAGESSPSALNATPFGGRTPARSGLSRTALVIISVLLAFWNCLFLLALIGVLMR
jgi:uncharacterized membrane protein YvbJ